MHWKWWGRGIEWRGEWLGNGSGSRKFAGCFATGLFGIVISESSTIKLSRLLGNLTAARLGMNLLPKVKLLIWQDMARECHMLQILIETVAKNQILKTAWPVDTF